MPFNSQYRKRKLPKDSRTIPLPGAKDRGNGEDFGTYFRCWNCGWICNLNRDSLGDSQGGSGEGYLDNGSDNMSGSAGAFSVMEEIGNESISLELAADGTPKNIAHVFESVISGGCPLCGSKNWKGEF